MMYLKVNYSNKYSQFAGHISDVLIGYISDVLVGYISEVLVQATHFFEVEIGVTSVFSRDESGVD